ncbi:MAG: fibrobacter succinogenes major paralogous domain-containing protein [Agriterribacter sp.]
MKAIRILILSVLALAGCSKRMDLNPVVTPAVATKYPINVTASSAEFLAESPDGGGEILSRGFLWMYKSETVVDADGSVSLSKADSVIIKQGTKAEADVKGSFKKTVTGLEKDTVLLVKAYASNSKGITYGETISFRTSAMVPPTVIISQDYENFGDTAVLVSAEVTKVGGALVTERGLIWGTHEDPAMNTNKMVLGEGQGEFSYTIPSLELFVKYYITSYAINAVGISYSEPLIVLFIPPTVTDLRDGEVYTVKQYGGVIWMTQNFRYLPKIGNDAGIWVQGYMGTDIAEAKATAEYKTYGALYNLQQAIDLAPEGWHLATDEEWKKLEIISSNGSLTPEGANALEWRPANAGRLKAWDGAGNDLQLNLLPGGKQWCGGAFQELGVWAHYWAAKEGHPYDSFFRRMLAGWENNIYRQDSNVDGYPVCVGMSARYVKD